jgi:hypothetical protein
LADIGKVSLLLQVKSDTRSATMVDGGGMSSEQYGWLWVEDGREPTVPVGG